MPRPDSPILRPSSHFKKLSYDQVCTILDLMAEVDASTREEDRLDEKEKDARVTLLEIKLAMEDKRAREDNEQKSRRRK